MRFSPVLLAVLAASTVFGVVKPAEAQSLNTAEQGSGTVRDRDLVNPLAFSRLDGDRRSVSSQAIQPPVQLAQAQPTVEPLAWATPAAIAAPEPDRLPVLAKGTPAQAAASAESTENATSPEITDQIAEIAENTESAASEQLPPSGSVLLGQVTPSADAIQVSQNQPAPSPSPAPSDPSPSPQLPTFTSPTVTPTSPTPTSPTPTEPEPRVLVSEVVVTGVTGDLETEVYNAIQTKPGFTTTRSQLQQDINAVFATGYFSNVQAVPEDTPLGVRVTFAVQPNPVLTTVRVQGNQVLPQTVVDAAFAPQYGSTLNLNRLQTGIRIINKWYQDNGYVLAQIIDAPQVSGEGVVTLTVAEGIIEDINVQFLTSDGELVDDEGNPIEGRTKPYIITREFESGSGDVFNQQQIQRDLQRAFGLGIFDDLQVTLNPGQDPNKVDVTVNVVERSTGSLAAGVGVSSASGLFGTVSYQQQNLGGNNQSLGAEIQLGERDLLFDVNFTDPWIAGDPYRTSYTVNGFSRRSIPLVFQGGDTEVELSNGDRPRVRRIGGGVSFGRPLDNGWRASAGIQYQNVRIQDADGELARRDELGNDLSFSGGGVDDLLLLQFSATQDRRDNPMAPTSGYLMRFGTDQTIPVGQGGILFNRLRGNYSRYIPVNFTNFTDGAETLAFNVQGGVVLGDLPPYEAFSLGGTDSVRGYDSGEVGSGRAFVLGTVEYRFPIFSIVGGALFVDFGTDLGTGSDVPGQPAVVRDKPGSGLGFGIGVRVQSPLGAIRVDYALNDEGDSRIHFGIGERF